MFQRILVPLDGSKLAEGVLPYVIGLGRKLQAEVCLLSVVPPETVSSRDASQQQYAHRIEEQAQTLTTEYLRETSKKLEQGGLHVGLATETGNPPETIVSYAEERRFDLIAMSTHGRSGITRWVMGNVADHVLRATSIPVLIIRPAQQAEEEIDGNAIQHLIVPLDSSELSEAALPYVEELAQRAGLDVVLIQAIPTLSQLYLGMEVQAYPVDVMEAVDESAKVYLSNVVARLQTKGIRARWETLRGDPAGTIVDFAKKTEHNIIAMSTRGRSGVRRWILGSVADKVVRAAGDPVLLIRPLQEGKE